jgi:hypothetical protein
MAIDPARLDAELDLLWRGLQNELQAGSQSALAPAARPSARRGLAGWSRRQRVLGVAVVASLSLAAAGGATAQVIRQAHTGEQSSGRDIQMAGPGEFLREDAPDFRSVIRKLTSDIPFAPGYQGYHEYTVTTWVAAGDPTNVRISTSAARAEVADQAICSWADYWAGADRADDVAGRNRATRALTGSLRWNAVTTLDSRPDPRGLVGDNGKRSPTRFGYLPATVRAAQAGDVDALGRALFGGGATYCVIEQLKVLDGERLLTADAR